MNDPYMTSFGSSYEKQLIFEFIQNSEKMKDPMTGKEIKNIEEIL